VYVHALDGAGKIQVLMNIPKSAVDELLIEGWDLLTDAQLLARAVGAMGVEVKVLKKSGRGSRALSGEPTVSLLRMPSGHRYVLIDDRSNTRLQKSLSYHRSLKQALLEYYLRKRDMPLRSFLKEVDLDSVVIEQYKPVPPPPSSVLGVILYDYFRVAGEISTYRDIVGRLESLARSAGAIGEGVEDLRRAVEGLRAALEAVAVKLDAMQATLIRLSDRTLLLQKLLEQYKQPELQPVRLLADEVARATEELRQTAEELRSLPSFAQGNPWLEVLSRGRQR